MKAFFAWRGLRLSELKIAKKKLNIIFRNEVIGFCHEGLWVGVGVDFHGMVNLFTNHCSRRLEQIVGNHLNSI